MREVLAPGPVARVPGAGHALLGLRPAGGELVVLADVGALLGTSSARAPGERYVVVLDDPEAPLGVLADAVEEMADVPRGSLRPMPEAGGLVLGVADLPGASVTGGTSGPPDGPGGLLVVDVDALLRDPRMSTSPLGAPAAHPPDRSSAPTPPPDIEA
ncbi:MAG: hypothetical protein GEV08_14370 [Acidimicrobiia bacterium]|nr:hypothetical protein [Acidimicrobiia bacterium]